MKTIQLAIAIAIAYQCLASVTFCDEESQLQARFEEQWSQYKQTYNKTYLDEQEHLMRYQVFKKSLVEIEQHNEKHSEGSTSFTVGLNHMSDWTNSERRKLRGYRPSSRNRNDPISPRLAKLLEAWRKKPLPESVDWSEDPRRVGPVRDQGKCGSCWAFGTVGMLEGQEFLNSTGGLMQLSAQNLLDCDLEEFACLGGDFVKAINYIIEKQGIEVEKDYPYFSGKTEREGKCKYEPSKAYVTTRYVLEAAALPSWDAKTLKLAVANYGPVVVGMDARSSAFHQYKSGVFEYEDCIYTPDHVVLIVGYGKTKEDKLFWKVKNSWGEEWGEQGYFYISRGDNMCEIETEQTIAIVQRPGYPIK